MKLRCFIISIVLLSLFSAFASAETQNIGLYLLNLGKFDISSGAFTADFYLSMKCENECSSDFEFINGRAVSVDKSIDTPKEKFYRIQANLNSPVNLKKYPFDTQTMEIIIEDKRHTIEELEYAVIDKETDIDENIFFPGWKIKGFKAETREHTYGIYNETYSQYVVHIDIEREKVSSFFKTFLPVFVIILVVMFSFVMDTDKITTRLGLTGSSLVASVMFHVSIANQIPPIGYLTTADKFMILTYIILLCSVILNVFMLEMIEKKKHKLAERIHRITEYNVFIAVPLIYILFFIFVV